MIHLSCFLAWRYVQSDWSRNDDHWCARDGKTGREVGALEIRVINRRSRNKVLSVNPTLTKLSKADLWGFFIFTALTCATANSSAASLFGDLSCQSWADLEYPRKKAWTNAFLAPLSLTHQGLERTKQNRYNDDPNASDPAIVSIDKFCASNPKLGPADGAAAYLNGLIANWLGPLIRLDELQMICSMLKVLD